MANNIAVDLLLKERQRIKDELLKMKTVLGKQIRHIETAIEKIEGKQVWEYEPADQFDDTNPDYIKGSIED